MVFINPENEACDGLITVASGTYTLTRKDSLILCSGTCTIQFPDPKQSTGIKVFVKNISASGEVTLDFSTNSGTCDGADSQTLPAGSQYAGMEIICDGSEYYIRATGNLNI